MVTLLKKMNTTYPNTSSDKDLDFVRRLLKHIFTMTELEKCVTSIKPLNRAKLQFAKGTYLVHKILKCSFFLPINNLIFIPAIYQKRVDDDKKRMDNFRQHAIKIANELMN